MKITKFGHSCILLDDGQTKILFDPGSYSEIPELKVDAIVITHSHQDHYDIEKIQKLLSGENSVRIITNTEVKTELAQHGIDAEVVEEGNTAAVGAITIQAFGNNHAPIHPSLPIAQNTGYLVNGKIFHPGDALTQPSQPVEILLLPIFAPWSKVSETLDYIEIVKPKVCIPIHDAILDQHNARFFYTFAQSWCEKIHAQFIELALGKEQEI